MALTRKTLPALALAFSILVLAATAAYAARSAPLAKPPGGCTAAASRIAYSVNVNNSNDLYAVNPDGTCSVQLTTGNLARSVLAWTADKHILVGVGANGYRLFSVPNSTSASTVSTVATWTLPKVEDISQHRDASSVVPVTQQLFAAIENDNVVVYTVDRTVRTELTNWVTTYVSGGTGSEYMNSNARWLPDSADRSRIRLAYHFHRVDYVNGTGVSEEYGQRVLSMSTATWPVISTGSVVDSLIGGGDNLVGGYPLREHPLIKYSRDGAKAGMRGPFGDGIYVMPVIVNDTADSVTIDTANAVHVATSVGSQSIQHNVSFSPDNSKLVYQAYTTVGSGGNARSILSLFVIGSASPSGAVQVDGRTNDHACCPVWGPNGG